jgi:hypothetical protein
MEMRMSALPQSSVEVSPGLSLRCSGKVGDGAASAPASNAGIVRLEAEKAEIPPRNPLLLIIFPLICKPGRNPVQSLFPSQLKVMRLGIEVFAYHRREFILRFPQFGLRNA